MTQFPHKLWRANCKSLKKSNFFQDRRDSQDDDDQDHEDGENVGELREQDRFLPIANVARIMKKAIPSQVRVTHL